jgi:hypothetical protein
MAKRLQACSRLLKLTSWQILMPKSENFYISTLLRTILGRLRCGFQVFAIYPVPVFGVAMIFLPLFLHILPADDNQCLLFWSIGYFTLSSDKSHAWSSVYNYK